MDNLSIDIFKRMLERASTDIKAREDEFSQLDAQTGDGDHGTAIVAAFSAAMKVAKTGTEFKAMLNDIGFGIMLETSGSTSTLLGAFFLGMSDTAHGTVLSAEDVKTMFSAGLENVKKQTKADIGDKTMMDALIPAINAINSSTSGDIKQILSEGAMAAIAGAEATIDMVAKFGRARNYGERSKGFMDSGAASWSCMFNAFAEAI